MKSAHQLTLLFQQTQTGADPYLSVWITLLCSIVAISIALISSLRICREYQRLVIFRLGKYIGVRGPGIVLTIPFIDRGVIVELGEQDREVSLFIHTHEGAQVKFNMKWVYQIIEPEKSLLSVANLENTTKQLIETTLRTLTADMFISEVIHDRQRLEVDTTVQLRETLSMWGAELIRFEIVEILRG